MLTSALMLAQWTMDPQYIAVTNLFTKDGVYIAYKNGEPGATTPKTFLVRSEPQPSVDLAMQAFGIARPCFGPQDKQAVLAVAHVEVCQYVSMHFASCLGFSLPPLPTMLHRSTSTPHG